MLKVAIVAFVVLFQVGFNDAQGGFNLVPAKMTAAELWNPFSWYYPFGIAGANAWSDYLQNAQKATNQLYQQIQQLSNPDQNQSKQPETTKQPESTTQSTTTAATTQEPETSPQN